MPTNVGPGSWLRRATGGTLVLLIAGSLPPPPASAASNAVGPAPAGTARIWFYRDYEPSVSLNLAPVALNGTVTGYVQPDGSALYRDVPAGHYHITALSEGTDVNQAKDIDLAPGEVAYVKILSAGSWEAGGDLLSYHRDTFYVSVVPPQIARAELSTRP